MLKTIVKNFFLFSATTMLQQHSNPRSTNTASSTANVLPKAAKQMTAEQLAKTP